MLEGQLGFFDLNRRYESLDEKNDLLVAIAAMVPFESFRSKLKAALIKGELRTSDATRKSLAGRKPWDEVMIFKVLVLQALYNLSNDQMEILIFCGRRRKGSDQQTTAFPGMNAAQNKWNARPANCGSRARNAVICASALPATSFVSKATTRSRHRKGQKDWRASRRSSSVAKNTFRAFATKRPSLNHQKICLVKAFRG